MYRYTGTVFLFLEESIFPFCQCQPTYSWNLGKPVKIQKIPLDILLHVCCVVLHQWSLTTLASFPGEPCYDNSLYGFYISFIGCSILHLLTVVLPAG